MTWSLTFRRKLAEGFHAPRFAWETLEHREGVGRTVRLVSDQDLDGIVGLAEPLRVGGQHVAPVSWLSTTGAFSVSFADSTNATLLSYLTRGQLCRLMMGFEGWAEADFQPIALGQVRNVRGVSPLYQLDAWDILSALQTRITTTSDEQALFHDVGATTTLGANYTAGDATVTVGATAGFQRETGGEGAIKITPTTGDPFYLTYTGTTGTTFTGCSATGKLGTTAVNAVIGDAVAEVAYLKGHPLFIVRKMLLSTGTGTNGGNDVYPESWGWGIDQSLVDEAFFGQLANTVVTVSSGSYTWEIGVETEQAPAGAFILNRLAAIGVWLVVRQGKIAPRAAQNLQTAASIEDEITDEDIESVESWEAFASDQRVEYDRITVLTGDSGAPTTTSPALGIGTLPSAEALTVDLTDRVFDNGTAIANDVIGRLGVWATRIAERMTVTCAGYRLAKLAPGDVVNVTTTAASGRLEAGSGADGYEQRRAMVTEVSPDWTRSRVRLTLSLLPSWTSQFP